MTKIIISLLLIAPVFAAAETKDKTDVYRTITGELLKDCTGTNKVVAVAGFSYSDGRDSRDGGVVAERITTELVKAKKFKVIERKEIEKVFEELKLQRSGAIDSDSAKEIGQMLGADWVVVGTLTELPDKQLELNARLVAVESGEIITAVRAPIKKDWLDQFREILVEQNKVIEKNSKKVKTFSDNNVEKNLKNAQLFYERGVMYTDLGESDNAIASFSIAISMDSTCSKAYLGRGDAYYLASEHYKAIEDYSRAITINPTNTDAYWKRGFIYHLTGDYAKAIEDFSKAIAIDPKYVDLYIKRGNTYFIKGEYDKAFKDYSKLIVIDPNNASAYYARGVADGNRGEYSKAREDYFKAIAIDPKYAEANYKREIVFKKPCYTYDCLCDIKIKDLKPVIDEIFPIDMKEIVLEARKKVRVCYSEKPTDNIVVPPEIMIGEGEKQLLEYMCRTGLLNR